LLHLFAGGEKGNHVKNKVEDTAVQKEMREKAVPLLIQCIGIEFCSQGEKVQRPLRLGKSVHTKIGQRKNDYIDQQEDKGSGKSFKGVHSNKSIGKIVGFKI
jgi:hypothetical protein